MDCNNLCLTGFFVLMVGLILIVLNLYHQTGDIGHMSKVLNYCEIEKKYNCPKLILSRLYQILHFKFNYVYWVYFTLLSVLSSVLINYILSQIYNFKKVVETFHRLFRYLLGNLILNIFINIYRFLIRLNFHKKYIILLLLLNLKLNQQFQFSKYKNNLVQMFNFLLFLLRLELVFKSLT